MALPASTPLLQLKTYDDLLALPDDGNRYELIRGEIFMSPAPKLRHQRASRRLQRLIEDFLGAHGGGEVIDAPFDVRFSVSDVVQPDLFIVRPERAAALTEDFMEGAPDLVVEVLSPSNRAQDLVKKAALYQAFGVPEYWVVDPESEVIVVNVLREGRYIPAISDDGVARSSVLPAFEVRPDDIFALPTWMTEAAVETET